MATHYSTYEVVIPCWQDQRLFENVRGSLQSNKVKMFKALKGSLRRKNSIASTTSTRDFERAARGPMDLTNGMAAMNLAVEADDGAPRPNPSPATRRPCKFARTHVLLRIY